MDVKQRNGIIFDFFLKTSIKIRPNIGKKIKNVLSLIKYENPKHADESNKNFNSKLVWDFL